AAQRKREEEEFKAEVERFKDKDLDIAFVPVDIRLEEHYHLAGEYFAETVEPELLVPIHFSNNYYITEKFAGEINDLDVESAVIKGRGTKLIYNK
ncbi:MAG: MBL fold metallo-hydrolase, partial [Halanaerobacter sp.]